MLVIIQIDVAASTEYGGVQMALIVPTASELAGELVAPDGREDRTVQVNHVDWQFMGDGDSANVEPADIYGV